MGDPVMLRELLEAYAETLKMGVEAMRNDKTVNFWRPWLERGKLFGQLAAILQKLEWDTIVVVVRFGVGNMW